ncbi:MAG TPA: sterol desaturase family protein [Burkholderiaceae bacterium]|nr:sterol desaturase family protein [Burkholderiaceae bacterium]
MVRDLMLAAVPVFFMLIAVELALGRWRRQSTYRLSDSINSLSLGTLSQVTGVYTRVLRIGIYTLAFDHVALGLWPVDAWWAWVAALLFYDFCYYWYHRASHRVGMMWANHVVHHSSEEFNLSTALRQPSTGALFSWAFYLPMAVAGVPPLMFAVVALIDLLYQYWVHTRHVGRLGWFDRVFVSPSNHRVHHGLNDAYVDRNYGGVLIVWDRMFGTYAEERDDEPVVYGSRAPLRSWNPLWGVAHVYWALARDAWRARRWRDKLQVWLRPPGWRPADVAAADPRAPFSLATFSRYDVTVPRAVQWYAAVQFALVVIAAVLFGGFQRGAAAGAGLAYLAWIVVSLVSIGALLEGRRGFFAIEAARLAVAAAAIAWLATQ